jgi:soluble lytic murein transglycosylase-like protein
MDAKQFEGRRLRAVLPKIAVLAGLSAAIAGCSGLPLTHGSAMMAIAQEAPSPAPLPGFATEEVRPGYVPASVLSYADAVGPSADTEALMAYYADVYDVPLRLVRRVAARESNFNPAARNGPYYGIMQIRPATARTMGYRGTPEGLLDPDINLKYAVKYLAGAYLVSGGNEARADRFYQAGYYYDAKRKGLLEETGLRP